MFLDGEPERILNDYIKRLQVFLKSIKLYSKKK